MSHPKVLYVSYDGLLEPLGQSQVLAYLLPLSKRGVRLVVFSFEKSNDLKNADRVNDLERTLERHGIDWIRSHYHRRPRVVSTVIDILIGTFMTLYLIKAKNVDISHARSYIPALLGIVAKRLTGVRFVFDMRGFWPEERVELGIFRPGGILLRASKYFEKFFLAAADRIVVLTRRAKDLLCKHPSLNVDPLRVEVIPCCVAPSRFVNGTGGSDLALRHDLAGSTVVGNIGAVSSLYLVPQMFRFAYHLKKHVPNLRFVYLTRQASGRLHKIATAQGLQPRDVLVTSVRPEEIPDWLSLFQLGVFFPKPTHATQAMCPTKLGEFLAAGVPLVTSGGVGDVDGILGERQTAILLREFSEPALKAAAARAAKWLPVSNELRARCRRLAREQFDLAMGVSRYLAVYEALRLPYSVGDGCESLQEAP